MATNSWFPPNTLVINMWSTHCSDCNENILDMEGEKCPGCGVQWENVGSDYSHMKVGKLRPDLKYIDLFEGFKNGRD